METIVKKICVEDFLNRFSGVSVGDDIIIEDTEILKIAKNIPLVEYWEVFAGDSGVTRFRGDVDRYFSEKDIPKKTDECGIETEEPEDSVKYTVLKYRTMLNLLHKVEDILNNSIVYMLCKRNGNPKYIRVTKVPENLDLNNVYFLDGEPVILTECVIYDGERYTNVDASGETIQCSDESAFTAYYSDFYNVERKYLLEDTGVTIENYLEYGDIVWTSDMLGDLFSIFACDDDRSQEDALARMLHFKEFAESVINGEDTSETKEGYLDIFFQLDEDTESFGVPRTLIEPWEKNRKYYMNERVLYNGVVYRLVQGSDSEMREVHGYMAELIKTLTPIECSEGASEVWTGDCETNIWCPYELVRTDSYPFPHREFEYEFDGRIITVTIVTDRWHTYVYYDKRFQGNPDASDLCYAVCPFHQSNETPDVDTNVVSRTKYWEPEPSLVSPSTTVKAINESRLQTLKKSVRSYDENGEMPFNIVYIKCEERMALGIPSPRGQHAIGKTFQQCGDTPRGHGDNVRVGYPYFENYPVYRTTLPYLLRVPVNVVNYDGITYFDRLENVKCYIEVQPILLNEYGVREHDENGNPIFDLSADTKILVCDPYSNRDDTFDEDEYGFPVILDNFGPDLKRVSGGTIEFTYSCGNYTYDDNFPASPNGVIYKEKHPFTVEDYYCQFPLGGYDDAYDKHFIYLKVDYEHTESFEGFVGEPDKVYASIEYKTDPATEFQPVPYMMDDAFLGYYYGDVDVEDLVIDRGMATAFERHNILGEVSSFDDLLKYKNGFLSIRDDENI